MKINKPIENIETLDILDLYLDAIELVLERGETDEDNYRFSEFVVKPPNYMVSAAKRGLDLREKQTDSNKCCTPTGIARARQLSNKENLTISTIKRIKSFAARHSDGLASAEEDSKKVQALLMWGVPATASGVEKVIKWCDRQIARYEKQKEKK